MANTLQFVLNVNTATGQASLQQFNQALKNMGTQAQQSAKQASEGMDILNYTMLRTRSVLVGLGVTFGAVQIGQQIRNWTEESIRFNKEFANVTTLFDTAAVSAGKMRSELLSLDSTLGGM